MEHSTKKTGTPKRCLRPVESSIDTILIHAATGPEQLQGCVAPRLWGSKLGEWNNSNEAMDRRWKVLGGWEEGKEVTLQVLNNYSGETRTKEAWISDRKKTKG